jgi:hypothetical protein
VEQRLSARETYLCTRRRKLGRCPEMHEHVLMVRFGRLGAHHAKLVALFGDQEGVVLRGRPDQPMSDLPLRVNQ